MTKLSLEVPWFKKWFTGCNHGVPAPFQSVNSRGGDRVSGGCMLIGAVPCPRNGVLMAVPCCWAHHSGPELHRHCWKKGGSRPANRTHMKLGMFPGQCREDM